MKGGQDTKIIKDQTLILFPDNRRAMIFNNDLKEKIGFDFSNNLIDSNPLNDINQCKSLRFISKFPITLPFTKQNTNRSKTVYKNYGDLVLRNFIKAYYSKNEKFGLKGTEFPRIKDLINFINGIESTKEVNVTVQSISNLKNR